MIHPFESNAVYNNIVFKDVLMYVCDVRPTDYGIVRMTVYFIHKKSKRILAGPDKVKVHRREFHRWQRCGEVALQIG